MFLKSLVLRGFKSFADRTTLAFEPGISVVVGPNGSGKSNVVDAIVWVMGEQGVTTLRGGKMEDVIFGGSKLKPPLGMAEVQLTIDNSAGLLPVEFTEVSISRTLFRSGDSEYRLNGSTCRLLDIQELLSDAGVGKEHHTIVGQGRLDQVLSADPVMMRSFIEDSAGLGKHRRRKDRALRKIQASEGNLVHLGDLLAEIRRQLRPLRQQAELAERHDKISAELRRVRIVGTARELAEVKQKLGPAEAGEQLQSHVAAQELELAALDSQIAGFQERREQGGALSVKQREVQWRLSAAQDRLQSIRRLADERQRTLRAELASNHEAVEQARLVGLLSQLEELQAEQPEAEIQRKMELAARDECLRIADEAKTELRRSEEAIARAGRTQAEANAGVAALRRELALLGSSRQAAESDGRLIEERIAAAARRRAELGAALEQAATASSALKAEEDARAERFEQAEARRSDLENLRARLLEEVRGLEKGAAVLRAREGARASADKARKERTAGLRAQPGSVLLSDLVELEPGHKRALEALVGPIDGVVVAAGEQAAEQILAAHNPDDAITVLVAGRPAGPVTGAERLIARVKVLSEDAQEALADVYLAGSLADAISLAGKHRHAVFLTAEGTLAMGSFVSRGSAEIADAVQRCERQLVVARDGMKELEDQLRRARQELEKSRIAQKMHRGELARATEAVHSHEKRLQAVDAEIAQLEESSKTAVEKIRDLGEQAGSLAGRIAQADLAARSNEEQAAGVREQHLALQAKFDEAARQAEEARLKAGLADERCRRLVRSVTRFEASLLEANRRLAGAGRRQAALSGALDAAGAVARSAALLIAGSTGWTVEAEERYRHSLATVAGIDHQMAELRQLRQRGAEELETQRAIARREDLGRSELKVRERILEARLQDDLHADPLHALEKFGRQRALPEGTAPEDPLERISAMANDVLRRRQVKLERDLEQLGNVNPLAAREAEALAEREEFLAAQIADVRASRKDLREIVESVDEKIRVQFSAAFADVSREYERLFLVLFPNGRGRLSLTDPTELLESGVEVEASPQGRNLKRLSLLSGGERALSALALLFSIFRARPSPFYILDEVEAALDDVNLQRFLGLLHDFRGTSQLLVVSHQKRTMEIADVLYGVAIRPDGVSRVISERLSELFPAAPIVTHERGSAP